MSSFLEAFRLPPGPRPFQAIEASQFKTEIDQRLFLQRLSVARVHEWLVDEGEISISYATLNRYRNAAIKQWPSLESTDLDRTLKSLSVLDRIVAAGETALEAGTKPRPSDVLKAIEIRNHLLKSSPAAAAQAQEVFRRQLEAVVDAVRAVVTTEQLQEIHDRLAGPSAKSNSDADAAG